MGGTLDPEEREYFAEVKSRLEKAFSGATRLLRTDTRWHLIQAQAERAKSFGVDPAEVEERRLLMLESGASLGEFEKLWR
jgi:hypothetical protein